MKKARPGSSLASRQLSHGALLPGPTSGLHVRVNQFLRRPGGALTQAGPHRSLSSWRYIAMPYCSSCGASLSYCTSCGELLDCTCRSRTLFQAHRCRLSHLVTTSPIGGNKYCSDCGEEYPTTTHCSSCGADITPPHRCRTSPYGLGLGYRTPHICRKRY